METLQTVHFSNYWAIAIFILYVSYNHEGLRCESFFDIDLTRGKLIFLFFWEQVKGNI